MKIVILDSQTVTGGNVSLERITALADSFDIYDFSESDEIIDRIADADAVFTNKCLITSEVFERCPNLRYVGLFSTGFNNVDLKAAKERNCPVCNVPGYSTDAVAQHVFALILSYYSKVSEYAKTVSDGEWCKAKMFTYFDFPLYELSGKTIGIIGFGNIGRAVAKIALAFNMKVLAYTRTKPLEDCGAEFVSLNELLEKSDIVSLHCPLNSATAEIINEKSLSKIKRGAALINTARGGLVNEEALANALNSGRLAFAGLDVVSVEPMREDNPLRSAKNIVITPHVAWAPKETRDRLVGIVAENFRCWLEGKPENNVAR